MHQCGNFGCYNLSDSRLADRMCRYYVYINDSTEVLCRKWSTIWIIFDVKALIKDLSLLYSLCMILIKINYINWRDPGCSSGLISFVHYRKQHYGDVIMGMTAYQITRLTIVYSIVYSDADQRKHQSSASLAFLRGIRRGPVNSPQKWTATRKMFPFDDVIMNYTRLPMWLLCQEWLLILFSVKARNIVHKKWICITLKTGTRSIVSNINRQCILINQDSLFIMELPRAVDCLQAPSV